MRSISVTMNISLDGVVQGLGRPDEDTQGGFTHGGWGTWHQDEVLAAEMGKGMSRAGDLLLGRRTWQDFINARAHREDDNPFTTHLNAVTKYVASRTLQDADAWQNSVLLPGDAATTVAIRRQHGATLIRRQRAGPRPENRMFLDGAPRRLRASVLAIVNRRREVSPMNAVTTVGAPRSPRSRD